MRRELDVTLAFGAFDAFAALHSTARALQIAPNKSPSWRERRTPMWDHVAS
jgi:hypothetical protein